MSLVNVAVLGSQVVLGAAGLGMGGAKVTRREGQVEAFRRFGYPQWFRVVTGAVEVLAGAGLITGLLWRPELALAGGLLLGGVMAGAVATHVRAGDPPSNAAVPGALFVLTTGLLAVRYFASV